jgi:tetratricopeptide (TPR) repeat protein
VSSSAGADRVIGSYRLVRRLGAGGMGEVFLAHDSRLDRLVAVKHAHAQLATPEQRARFRREAWAAARLAHPAIVPVFDILSDEDGDWIVMEHVDGPTLREHLAAQGPPPPATAAAWAAQIAEGLAAAHAKGIIHRDLKTENVMIAASGHLKIVDFGLAKPLAADDPGLTLSGTGAVLGTPRSMAPEQARGHQVGPRADLFSLGVLLYELLTGVSPFAGGGPLDVLTRLAVQPHDPVTAHNPAVPPKLAALVDSLLAKSPEARPASAAAVAEALRGIAFELGSDGYRAAAGPEDAPTVVSPAVLPEEGSPSTQSFAAMPAGRRRWEIGLLALLVLIAAGTAVSIRSRGGTPPPSTVAVVDDDPYALYQAGMARLDRWDKPGHVDAAIGQFQRALSIEPRSAPVLAGLSRAYWRKSRLAGRDPQFLRQARAVAEQAVALDGHLAAARISLGLAAVDLGDLAAAEAAFARAELLQPGSAAAAQGRGNLALARNDLAAAEAAYREAIARGETAELHNALGTVLFRRKLYVGAEAAFRRAVELTPDSVQSHRNLAGVLYERGDSTGAASHLQRAIEIAPNASLYTNLGAILFFQGRYAEANAAFEHAIAAAGREGTGTNIPMLWANLGDSYRFLPGREDDARLAFRRAAQLARVKVKSNPGDIGSRSRLALYLAKAGDKAVARRELDAVLAHAELDVEARLRALLAYEVLGDRAAALTVLADALRAGLPIAEVEREPELAAFRADPGYHRLVAAMAGG